MLEKSEEYFKQGRFGEALKYITLCTNSDMKNEAAWKLKIKILIALNQLKEAEDCREIVWDIQKKRQLEYREKTPELTLPELAAYRITLNLASLTAGQQLAAFINGRAQDKRLKRK